MPKVHHVKARKDYPEEGIEKGDDYYWWSFRFGPKVRSKTAPKRSQLTGSSFLSQLYDLEDGIETRMRGVDASDLEMEIGSLVDDLQTLADECQDSLDNMPEQFQEAESGLLLQERIEGVEGWVSDLESIDTDYDWDHMSPNDILEHADTIIQEIHDTNPGLG